MQKNDDVGTESGAPHGEHLIGAEAATRDDLARNVARAWGLAVGCDTQREYLRTEMPHLGWALDRLADAYGVTR